MKKTLMTMAITAFLAASALPALAEDSYLALKVGGFLPNGKGDATSQGGFKDFDTGYDVEVAFGFRPATYAAIELGSGFYSTQRQITATALREKATAYGVPVTATVKGILNLEKTDLFAGAGAGYYFGVLTRDRTEGTQPTQSSSSHGNALGYHLCGGFDYNLSDRYSVGAEIKWFSAKPKFDDATGTGNQVEWEFGGTVFNLGMKYKF